MKIFVDDRVYDSADAPIVIELSPGEMFISKAYDHGCQRLVYFTRSDLLKQAWDLMRLHIPGFYRNPAPERQARPEGT